MFELPQFVALVYLSWRDLIKHPMHCASETRTSQVFMSTNSRVSPPTVSTRERVPERKDLGSQENSEKRKKYLEKMAEQEKKLDDGKALPSAKDDDWIP